MIIGGFTSLLNAGGVERINRHCAAIFTEWAMEQGEEYKFLSINDPPGLHTTSVDGTRITFRGYSNRKIRFALALIGAYKNGTRVFLGHPNFAPIGLVLHVLDRECKYWISTYGIDVWQPLSWVHRRGLFHSKAVLSISTFTTAQLVKAQNIPVCKAVTLPPALDPEFAQSALHSDERRLDADKDSFVLLTVSRLSAAERYKGVDSVIQALPQLLEKIPVVQYIIVGDGDDRSRLQHLAEVNGVAKYVTFLGEKSDKELQEFYKTCDVFVMPSRKEGFGIVFLEAMAYGKVTIGGNHGGTPDVIVDGETGFLVEYADINTLVDRLQLLAKDKLLRHEMGRKGRKRVEEIFTFDHYRNGLLKVIANTPC